MTDAGFAFLAALLKERSGLTLGPDKIYLLETRLMPIARRERLADVTALIAAMQAKRDNGLIDAVVEAMTTNETLFFRDHHPFDALRQHILPALIAQRSQQRSLRIWSAACSTGQEPYSIAMLLCDSFPELASWKVEIVATDISPAVLERASEGHYSAFEVQRGLPVHLLVKHFEQAGERWRIKPELRRMVNFRLFNLLDGAAAMGVFDVIFCRNVLIYFDHPTKTAVLGRLSDRLAQDGSLILGGAESVFGISNLFTGVDKLRGVYRQASARATQHNILHSAINAPKRKVAELG